MTNNSFDVIIVGGSYAGLSAAMSLGRSLRKVLIIDSGKRCNRQTPYTHNFITHDGTTPKEIADKAKEQVLSYNTITYHSGLAKEGTKKNDGFVIKTDSEETFTAKKLVFATGVKDIMPDIKGFSECWGISILHCPYCHGYEVKKEKTGILLNGTIAFELSKIIKNLTDEITIFTNGKSTFTKEQEHALKSRNIQINEKPIIELLHDNGQIKEIKFGDNSTQQITAVYAHPNVDQHCDIPLQLGCQHNEHKLLETDNFQKTSIPGIYACGDNSNPQRTVSLAVASGTIVGAALNKELVDEEF